MSNQSSQQQPPLQNGFERGIRHGFGSSRSILNPSNAVPDSAPNSNSFGVDMWGQQQLPLLNHTPAPAGPIAFREDIFQALPPPPTPLDTLMSSPPRAPRTSSAASNITVRANLQQQAQAALNTASHSQHPAAALTTPDISPTSLVPLQLSHTSVSSTSLSTGSSTSHGSWHGQERFFALLQEICTEAARRRWHSEVQRRMVDTFAVQHRATAPTPAPATNINGNGVGVGSAFASHHGQSRRAPAAAATPRFSPYMRIGRRSGSSLASSRSWVLYDYLSGLANLTWETARAQTRRQASRRQRHQHRHRQLQQQRQRQRQHHEAEARAVEEMANLYRLGAPVVAAAEAAADGGDVYSVEEVVDIALAGSALCRMVGYEEGWQRCEEMMQSFVAGEAGGIL